MAFSDTIADYRSVGLFRFADAKELMEPPTADAVRSDASRRHLRGAMYLVGYAAECFLKAYLIGQTGSQTLLTAMDILNQQRTGRGQQPVDNIATSAAGHRLGYLLQLTDLMDYDEKLWGRVGKWQSTWRYNTSAIKREEAQDFVADIESAMKYLSPKIGN